MRVRVPPRCSVNTNTRVPSSWRRTLARVRVRLRLRLRLRLRVRVRVRARVRVRVATEWAHHRVLPK